MLTPQEVTNCTFEKAVFGGYDTNTVDEFMNRLSKDYAALYHENTALKSKMKVLVDKVEEYRSTEDAMHMALLQAKRTASEIITEAEARRDSLEEETDRAREELLTRAEEETEARRTQLREELAAEEAALSRAKKLTASYLEKLKTSMTAYAEALGHIYDYVEPMPSDEEPEAPEETAEPEAPPEEEKEPESSVSQETVENIAEIINRAFSSLEASEKAAAAEKNLEHTIPKIPHINYGDLQFGKNYNPGKK